MLIIHLPSASYCLMAEILHQLRLVVYPIIYKVLAPSQVVTRISEPSTVLQGVLISENNMTWIHVPGELGVGGEALWCRSQCPPG